MKMNLSGIWLIFLITILSFLLHPARTIAGENIDSLNRVILMLPDNQEKAESLTALVKEYFNLRINDSALIYCNELITLSESLGFKPGLAEGHYYLSLIQLRKFEILEAHSSILQFLKLAGSMNDTIMLGRGYYTNGTILSLQGIGDSALYYYRKALGISLKANNIQRSIAALNAMGNLYQDQSEFDSAAFYYLGATRLCEEHGEEQYLGQIYNNLGKTLYRLYELEESQRYLEMSLEINRKKNNLLQVALNLNNLGGVYEKLDEFDKALEVYDQALEIYKVHGNQVDIADIYNNSASVYLRQNKYKAALENYKQAYTIYKQNNYAEGVTISLKNMGDAYMKLGRTSEAEAVLDSSLAVATTAGHKKNRQDILEAISRNYSLAGDFRKAYEYHVMYSDLYDTIFNLDKTKLINSLKLQYEREKDQTQILTLKSKNLEMELDLRNRTSQRNRILYGIFAVFAVALFLTAFLRQRVIIANNKIRQLEEEKKLMAAKMLVEGQEDERKRIARELHDGLGVLLSATKMHFTTIKDLSPENKLLIEKATQLLEQASGDVRKISHNMMPGLLTKLGLYEAVEDLFDSIGDTVDIEAICEISGDKERLPENKEIMIYRIIQEMVNNTIKHARASSIELKMEITPAHLRFIYKDNGAGFDIDKVLQSKTETLGLKSMQSRIHFLNGDVKLDSRPGKGICYTVNVPF